MVFLGYEAGSKAYQLYDSREGKVTVLREIFDEKAAWDWGSRGTGEANGVQGTFVVEHLVTRGARVVG